jgi:poly(3-hydroxybutyrate) depolymerase
MRAHILVTTLVLTIAATGARVDAQTGAGQGRQGSAPAAVPADSIEITIPPGANFDKANFRLWLPKDVKTVRAIAVLVPGSNGDGRAMANDAAWQAFATKEKVALVGCQITDKPHDQSFLEDYVNVSHGAGQALVDALTQLASKTSHPELAGAPIMLWGMSAGGEFDYEFAAWKPERVIAFVVNKGGIYYTALASRATRSVPALLFIGEKDLETRIDTITGIFAVNRRAAALWALTQEPGAAHVVARSQELGIKFFEDVLPLRLPDTAAPDGSVTLKTIDEQSGFTADLKGQAYQPASQKLPPNALTSWLPTENMAKAWQAVVTGKPFDGQK